MKAKPEKLNLIIGVIIILSFISFSYLKFSLFELIERNLYDVETVLSGHTIDKPPQIALIEIDDKSIDHLGKWPWPRSLLAQMIDILDRNGVKVIGVDIPLQAKELNPILHEIKILQDKIKVYPPAQKDIGLKNWLIENLGQIIGKFNNDLSLVNSVKSSGKIILPAHCNISNENKSSDNETLLFSKCFLTSSNISNELLENISVDEITPPFSELAQSALGFGHDILAVDNIMGVRLPPLFINYKGGLFPSFPLRISITYLNLDTKQVQVSENHIRLGAGSIPLINGKMLLKFTKNKKEFIRFSFIDLLNLNNDVPALKGKIALIGFNYSGGKRFNTPLSSDMPESEITAEMVNGIINYAGISRPFWVPFLELILLVLTGFFTVITFPRKASINRLVWTIGSFIILLLVSFFMIYFMNIWFKPTYIATCLIVIFLCFTIIDILFPEEAPRKSFGMTLEQEIGLKEKQSGRSDDLSGNADNAGIKEPVPNGASDELRSQVGRYKIICELGKGSMGLVYKAQDPKINRMVAIKTIRLSDEFDEDVIQEIKERFFREAEIAGKLSHPSIVTIHDVGEDQDLTYIAMEYIEGKDLEQFIKKDNLLPFKKVLDIVTKIAEALDFAHTAEVIHRDIKPANVMLLNDGQVKVTDFGIAKAISSSRTKTGVILGTPNYMSPEQIMGQKIDARSDIFSLGVLFFQLITGELPFHGENLSGLLYQITQVKHPSPRNYNPKIPKVCEQIIDKALVKDPQKRFKSAGDMAKVIKLLISRIDQLKKTKAKDA